MPSTSLPTLLPRHLAIFLMMSVATMFAANHVSARLAFDNGAGLLLAVLMRSGVACLILLTLVVVQKKRLWLPPGTWPWQLAVGLLIAIQSVSLYSAVARLPVVIALLLVNTFPIQLALLSWALGGPRPSLRSCLIMGTILIGLLVVLDIPSWFGDANAMGSEWLVGIGFGLSAAFAFACALWVTEHRLSGVGSTLRSLLTMQTVFIAMIVGGLLGAVPGGMSLPDNSAGWTGLALLALLYGSAFSLLFIFVPRLDMARNAPVMNFEPVASLLLGYIVLGQMLTPSQLVGGAVVVGGIVVLSLSKGR
ncbi:EamA family transporter [Vreelandella alkaliphila]|uniref:EamA family transporter n=1 Tax=Halomonas campaniensis TaxID=213554 RepID=A0A3D0KEB3_9GAMM|nr:MULTISPECIES: DMT family transporter [Halomonas]MDX1714806.1 DMT family transporter [Halomonas venusta]WAM52942.1 DMT family transporter [Halomonas venusta]HCA01873.1 EamA family transporter [Halomonas campaniensis]